MSTVKSFATKAYSLTLNKQFVFFAGVGLMIILLFFSYDWVKTPDFAPLFTSLSSQDERNVIKLLDANGISYQLSPTSGMILVSGSKINSARMIMARHGLPSTSQDSYELLLKNEGIYTSQANEDLIKQRILEENIQKAIETINGVQAAKVQLALPHHTDFMQQIIYPKASIILKLQPGVTLSDEQINGISYLVSSSVPYMKPTDVTIVDQTGQLLSGEASGPFSLSSEDLKYKKELEAKLSRQISNVLTPIVGRDNLRVQVNANINFDAKENTTKAYMPDKNSIQSQQSDKSVEKNGAQSVVAQGVPGALSNQPPKSGKLNEKPAGSGGSGGGSNASSTHDRETVNYSLGETITHTNYAKGEVKNLTVAILVNDRKVLLPAPKPVEKSGEKKETEVKVPDKYEPLKPEEIAKITTLAKDAIGFDDIRGDKITVVNQRFVATDESAKITRFAIPFYQQAWFLVMIKGFLFLIGFVVFAIFIWKPFFNSLFSGSDSSQLLLGANSGAGINASTEDAHVQFSPNAAAAASTSPKVDFDTAITQTKSIFEQSPDVAASVIKKWVQSSETE